VVKDGIVDHIRQRTQTRPNVVLDQPNVVVHAQCHGDHVTLSIDLSAESLNKRGYRQRTGTAPLRESLAAALVLRMGWLQATDLPLLDLFCGSGTILIEAALMASKKAPGLLRDYFGFLGWRGHQQQVWESLLEEARQRIVVPQVKLLGVDCDPKVLQIARTNANTAGVQALIHFEQADATDYQPPQSTGMVISNPPYNKRIQTDLPQLYGALGQQLLAHYQDWQVGILTEDVQTLKAMPLRPVKRYQLSNGPLECTLIKFVISEHYIRKQFTPAQYWAHRVAQVSGDFGLSNNALMLKNRIKKNLKHLNSWIKREQVSCYRIYDADIPEYAVAIDRYQDHIHIAEYRAPKTIEQSVSRHRFAEVVAVVHELFELPFERIHVKVRQQQKGKQQYEKQQQTVQRMVVQEGAAQLYVDLDAYLDTGLFLDHRLMRERVAHAASDKTLLNLFAYTCTASVHAALQGATVTSVDLSKTYLKWGQDNFRLNQLNPQQHQFIHADVIEWLRSNKMQYDVIFIDPPTFSNSKRIKERVFDVQRDHVQLIRLALKLLKTDGVLYFSNNYRNFKLDYEALAGQCRAKNISKQCSAPDFARRPNIHHCWEICK
jgi:23S rRNA (guanine2445-N2)-methyltransferase / 23S rRNA (guanine2069-N7)-methyltransferase